MAFTEKEKCAILKLARNSILSELDNSKVLEFETIKNALLGKNGVFVTLHTGKGRLRGCIGRMYSEEPLYKTVIEMAKEAAVGDRRFSPVTLAELGDLKIEISVLSPLKKIKDLTEIELGVHGVMVVKGAYSGVFLPQVAVETGWNLKKFMNNLCAGKAGLSKDAWKNKDTDIYVFTVEIIAE